MKSFSEYISNKVDDMPITRSYLNELSNSSPFVPQDLRESLAGVVLQGVALRFMTRATELHRKVRQTRDVAAKMDLLSEMQTINSSLSSLQIAIELDIKNKILQKGK